MYFDENLKQISEHTKSAFVSYGRKCLALKILKLLAQGKKSHFKQKNEEIVASISGNNGQQFRNKMGESKTTFGELEKCVQNNERAPLKYGKNNDDIEIRPLAFGDYIYIQVHQADHPLRLHSELKSLKYHHPSHQKQSVINHQKSFFQICSPTFHHFHKDENLRIRSLICLKNAFTNEFITVTKKISQANNFSFQLTFQAQIDQKSLFKIVSDVKNAEEKIFTNQHLSIKCFQKQLFLSMNENQFDKEMVACFQPISLKFIKVENVEEFLQPCFFRIKAGLESNLKYFSGEELNVVRIIAKKSYVKVCIETESYLKKPLQPINVPVILSQADERVYEADLIFGDLGTSQQIRNVWAIQKNMSYQSAEKDQFKITHLISNASMIKKEKQLKLSSKEHSLFQFQKHCVNQHSFYTIGHADKGFTTNLCLQKHEDKYMIEMGTVNQQKQARGSHLAGNELFELQKLSESQGRLVMKVLEISHLLRSNYQVFLKWGFQTENLESSLCYSVEEIKIDLPVFQAKVIQMMELITIIKSILQTSQLAAQNMLKEVKILDYLICYCKLLKVKIGKNELELNSEDGLSPFNYGKKYLQPLLFAMLESIYQIIQNNKTCSQIIINQSTFFNKMLLIFPELIGPILQEAIKNLSIFPCSKIISKENDELFQWTRLIDHICNENIQVQKKYIDIISEVAIDPHDRGIQSYQNKIRELLFTNKSKRKAIPKFGLQYCQNTQAMFPSIHFEIDLAYFLKKNQKLRTLPMISVDSCSFFLHDLFDYGVCKEPVVWYAEYITSLLNLARNLCKNRNKKLLKVMEDWGLTQNHFDLVFKSKHLSWDLKITYLDLYSSMFIDQDPLLPFHQKQVKCFLWSEIQEMKLVQKTGLLFRQFSDIETIGGKYERFDVNGLVMIEQFLLEWQSLKKTQLTERRLATFNKLTKILIEIIKFGYLTKATIEQQLASILIIASKFIKNLPNSPLLHQMFPNIYHLFAIREQIQIILYGINLLILLFNRVKSLENTFNIQQEVQLCKKTLNFEFYLDETSQASEFQHPELTTGSKGTKCELDYQIIQFTLLQIRADSLHPTTIKLMVDYLDMMGGRHLNLANFLAELTLITTKEEETIYTDFNGTISSKLLNVIKIEEIVRKIEQDMEVDWNSEDNNRKKEKILELNNILIKIIKMLEGYKVGNYRLFEVCQSIFQKLDLHGIIFRIVQSSSSNQIFHSLISTIYTFYLQFIRNHPNHRFLISKYLTVMIKCWNYKILPKLISQVFEAIEDKPKAFFQIWNQKEKRKDGEQMELILETMYRVMRRQASDKEFLCSIRNRLVQCLTSSVDFKLYVTCEKHSPNYVNILCQLSKHSPFLISRIKQTAKISLFINHLSSQHLSYDKKLSFLKLYFAVYFQNTPFQITDTITILNKIILPELRHLPTTCHNSALQKASSTGQSFEGDFEEKHGEVESKASLSKNSYRTQLKNALQSQFEQLISEEQWSIQPSSEEGYFAYLVNIDDEKEMSLLNFLIFLLENNQSSELCCEEERALQIFCNYVKKVSKFMLKIYEKKGQMYHSKILNKMNEVLNVLQTKYKFQPAQDLKPHYQNDKKIISAFYAGLARLIRKESITYYSLIKCFTLQQQLLQNCRNGLLVQKFILQHQFTSMLNSLLALINFKNEFHDFISEESIKVHYFKILKEPDSMGVNIYDFVRKLVEMVEYLKKSEIISVNQQITMKDEEKSLKQIEDALTTINVYVVNADIGRQYWTALKQRLLTCFYKHLTDQSKKKIADIYENQSQPFIPKHTNSKLFAIHQAHIHSNTLQYLTIKFISKQNQINNIIHFELDANHFSTYCELIGNKFAKCFTTEIIDLLRQIWLNLQLSHQGQIIVPAILNMVLVVNEELRKAKPTDQLLVILEKAYAFLDEAFSAEFIINESAADSIEQSVTNTLMHALQIYYSQLDELFWFRASEILCSFAVTNFSSFFTLEKNKFGDSNMSFTQIINLFLGSLVIKNLESTNLKLTNQMKILLLVVKLLEKMLMVREVHLIQHIAILQVSSIVMLFESPIFLNAEVESNTLLTEEYCLGGMCSRQFCQEGKKTLNDLILFQLSMQLLVIFDIVVSTYRKASNLTKRMFTNAVFLEKIIPTTEMNIATMDQRHNMNTTNNLQKSFERIGCIEVEMEGKMRKMHFIVPEVAAFNNEVMKQSILFHVNKIGRPNFFSHLNILSMLLEKQLHSSKNYRSHFLTNFAIINHQVISFVMLGITFLICLNLVLTLVVLPNIALYLVSCLILIFKCFDGYVFLKKYLDESKVFGEMPIKKDHRLEWQMHSLSQIFIKTCSSICIFFTFFYSFFWVIGFGCLVVQMQFIFEIMINLYKNIKPLSYVILLCLACFGLIGQIISGNTSDFIFGRSFLKMMQEAALSYLNRLTDHMNLTLFGPYLVYGLIVSILMITATGLFMALLIKDMLSWNTHHQGQPRICYICSVRKENFIHDSMFREHLEREHNIWNYLYFFIQLRIKRQLSREEAMIWKMGKKSSSSLIS